MSKQQYNPGKIGAYTKMIVGLIRNDPTLLEEENWERFRATVYHNFPDLNNKEKCPNCEASMREYIYKLDFLNALLLKEMGDEFKERMLKGLPFEEANQIHVVSMGRSKDYTRHRTTQIAKLGLIAKVKKKNGSHDRKKGWLITKRGFSALRGVAVPKEVTVWREAITERTDELVTLGEVFNEYRESVSSRFLRGKTVKNDWRPFVEDYSETDWVNFGNIHEGKLF